MNHKPQQDVNYGNHNSRTGLRVSTIKAVLLIVVDIKDGSPERSLLPGHICEVSVVVP